MHDVYACKFVCISCSNVTLTRALVVTNTNGLMCLLCENGELDADDESRKMLLILFFFFCFALKTVLRLC